MKGEEPEPAEELGDARGLSELVVLGEAHEGGNGLVDHRLGESLRLRVVASSGPGAAHELAVELDDVEDASR